MVEKRNSEAESRLKRAAEEILWDDDEIIRVETIEGSGNSAELIIEVEGGTNTFAGGNLEEFLERGFIPTSIAARENNATGWFHETSVGINVRD